MRIKLERNADQQLTLYLYGGWVSREVVKKVFEVLNDWNWNFTWMGGRPDALWELGNEIKIVFGAETSEIEVQKFIDVLNGVLMSVIPTGFTTIQVSPDKLPEYGDRGGLDVLIEIAKETNCDVDYGSWLTPVTFKPEDNVQYTQVLNLIRTFDMQYNNWCDQGPLYGSV